MKTPYGDYNVGDIYEPSSGARYTVTIVDVDTYAEHEDIVIQGPNGVPHRVDWFKMSYRYKKVEQCPIQEIQEKTPIPTQATSGMSGRRKRRGSQA